MTFPVEIHGNNETRKIHSCYSRKSEDGKAYVPTYIKTRIYIDLSDPGDI